MQRAAQGHTDKTGKRSKRNEGEPSRAAHGTKDWRPRELIPPWRAASTTRSLLRLSIIDEVISQTRRNSREDSPA